VKKVFEYLSGINGRENVKNEEKEVVIQDLIEPMKMLKTFRNPCSQTFKCQIYSCCNYVYMYVCMYVCMYVYIYVCVCVCIYTHIQRSEEAVTCVENGLKFGPTIELSAITGHMLTGHMALSVKQSVSGPKSINEMKHRPFSS